MHQTMLPAAKKPRNVAGLFYHVAENLFWTRAGRDGGIREKILHHPYFE